METKFTKPLADVAVTADGTAWLVRPRGRGLEVARTAGRAPRWAGWTPLPVEGASTDVGGFDLLAVGDELVVIVEGEVMVVHGEGPDARLIRTYGVGDHIGELAVLRAQPRAATVIACDDGVFGLAIGGAGLRAILEERPEAAMGMLATLADRISAQ